jgi:hypothetical protein
MHQEVTTNKEKFQDFPLSQKFFIFFLYKNLGLECNSVVKHVFSMCKILGSILSSNKKEKRKGGKKRDGREGRRGKEEGKKGGRVEGRREGKKRREKRKRTQRTYTDGK